MQSNEIVASPSDGSDTYSVDYVEDPPAADSTCSHANYSLRGQTYNDTTLVNTIYKCDDCGAEWTVDA